MLTRTMKQKPAALLICTRWIWTGWRLLDEIKQMVERGDGEYDDLSKQTVDPDELGRAEGPRDEPKQEVPSAPAPEPNAEAETDKPVPHDDAEPEEPEHAEMDLIGVAVAAEAQTARRGKVEQRQRLAAKQKPVMA